jgi:hypothetical protein
MMRIVIVWSDNEVLAKALEKVINTLCYDKLHAVIVMGRDEISSILKKKDSFDIPPHIIVWFSHPVMPNWIVQTVRWLRQSLFWEGGFVAMMRTKEDQLEMERTCLFGEKNAKFPYIEQPGHRAICEPIQLPVLLGALSEVGEISMETWYGLLDFSVLGSIQGMLNDAEKSHKDGDKQTAINIMQEVIAKMQHISWSTLVAHEKLPFVNNIINLYSHDSEFTSSDYDEDIKNIHKVLELAGVV